MISHHYVIVERKFASIFLFIQFFSATFINTPRIMKVVLLLLAVLSFVLADTSCNSGNSRIDCKQYSQSTVCIFLIIDDESIDNFY